MIDKSGQTVDR